MILVSARCVVFIHRLTTWCIHNHVLVMCDFLACPITSDPVYFWCTMSLEWSLDTTSIEYVGFCCRKIVRNLYLTSQIVPKPLLIYSMPVMFDIKRYWTFWYISNEKHSLGWVTLVIDTCKHVLFTFKHVLFNYWSHFFFGGSFWWIISMLHRYFCWK